MLCLTDIPQTVTVLYENPAKDWGNHLGYKDYPLKHSNRIYIIYIVINIISVSQSGRAYQKSLENIILRNELMFITILY